MSKYKKKIFVFCERLFILEQFYFNEYVFKIKTRMYNEEDLVLSSFPKSKSLFTYTHVLINDTKPLIIARISSV